jgi:hypothetical protein
MPPRARMVAEGLDFAPNGGDLNNLIEKAIAAQ